MALAGIKEPKKRSQDSNNPPSGKRSKSPGVHAVQGLLYDSEHGKTCHQCRHKIMYSMAACKNQKGNKLCNIKFCQKCLLNRYGEKAENVALFDDWKCPKCRSICNCSVCMKKRGHKPTGILVHTAKATGFKSVSDMLDLNDTENSGLDKSVQNSDPFFNKLTSPTKESAIVSPKKPGKENSFDGKIDAGLNLKNVTPNSANTKNDKAKQDGLKKMGNGNKGGGMEAKQEGQKEIRNSKKNNGAHTTQIVSQKSEVTMTVSKNVVECNWEDGCSQSETNSSKKRVLDDASDPATLIKQDENEQDYGGNKKNAVFANDDAQGNANVVKNFNSMKNNIQIVPLPEGNILTTIAGIEFFPEDVGNVLQFLEFCEAFGKVLSVRKGQPEAILQELKTGKREGGGQHSVTVRFHTKLLSLVQEDMEKESLYLCSENSWFEAMKKFISESEFVSKELSSVCDVKQYDQLPLSKKLKILNFLCDEVLCTIKLRSWIDDENSKSLQQEKEAKEKVVAAKSKEKSLKQKLQDRIAKAIIAKKGALSNLEHEAIVSRIKTKLDQAHAEMLEAMAAVPKRKQRSDAVRTEPILLDGQGLTFWKLTCFNDESNTLLQDMRSCGEDIPAEKWSMFNPEQQESLDNYISSIRHIRKIIKDCDF